MTRLTEPNLISLRDQLLLLSISKLFIFLFRRGTVLQFTLFTHLEIPTLFLVSFNMFDLFKKASGYTTTGIGLLSSG